MQENQMKVIESSESSEFYPTLKTVVAVWCSKNPNELHVAPRSSQAHWQRQFWSKRQQQEFPVAHSAINIARKYAHNSNYNSSHTSDTDSHL